jgi:IS66 C-terminal element
LIETGKANKLGPYACLRTEFTELPRATGVEAIEKLLPISTINNDDLADVSWQAKRRLKTCR